MQNRTRVIIIAIVLVLLIGMGVFFVGMRDSRPAEQHVSTDEPVDVVLGFYEKWLASIRAEDTDPYKGGVAKDLILGEALVKKLKDAKKGFKNGSDPVLCQEATPTQLVSNVSYILEDRAEIVVYSRDEGVTSQSVAVLTKLNDGWYISDISCSLGEFGEEREFSFENDGYVLKSAGLDGLYFIFAENGVFGNAVPLVVTAESVCRDLDGNESTCNADSFGEKTKAVVRGEMSEAGVSVKQLEFVEGSLSFE